MAHARQRCGAAGLDVDYRAHRGASPWQAREEARSGVRYSLTNELTVGVVAGLGDVVSDERGEE